jgi:hypothetical protein
MKEKVHGILALYGKTNGSRTDFTIYIIMVAICTIYFKIKYLLRFAHTVYLCISCDS